MRKRTQISERPEPCWLPIPLSRNPGRFRETFILIPSSSALKADRQQEPSDVQSLPPIVPQARDAYSLSTMPAPEKSQGSKLKAMRSRNLDLVLDIFRNSGLSTVPELSGRANLSKTTLAKIIDHLLASGYILPAGKGSSSGEGGKRPDLYRFNPARAFAVGIHIAPSAVGAALADLSGTILKTLYRPIKTDESLPLVVAAIGDCIRAVSITSGVDPASILGVAVGAHGITDIDSGVSLYSPHFPSWGRDVELKRLVSENLGFSIPVHVDNQIRFQVQAERERGAARGCNHVVVLEGGEGLVAGIIRDGVIHRGVHDLAGEIGHLPLDPADMQLCGCGARGCFELLVSCERVLADYLHSGGAEGILPSSAGHGRDSEPPAVAAIRLLFRLASEGNTAARTALGRAAFWFARGIAALILVEDPEIIVFQGIYAEAGPWFFARIREELSAIAIPKVPKRVRIEPSPLGPECCLAGATSFVVEQHFDSLSAEDWGLE